LWITNQQQIEVMEVGL